MDLVYRGGGPFGVAVSAYDEGGIHVVSNLDDDTAPWLTVSGGGVPTSFQILNDVTGGKADHLYWIERGGDLLRPALFRAYLDFGLGELAPEELGTYPFDDGTHGRIHFTQVHGAEVDFLAITDRSGTPPFSMHLGIFTLETRSWMAVDFGPSLGATEITTTVSYPWSNVDKPAPIARYMLDPPSVAVHGVAPDGSSIVAVESSVWDYAVVGATGADPRNQQSEAVDAFVTTDGTVYVWNPGPLPEVQAFLFGSVAPGTTQLVAVQYAARNGVRTDYVALESTGELVYLANNGADQSLRPQRFKVSDSCTTCVLHAWRESEYLLVATDDRIQLFATRIVLPRPP